jgi:hypothetical protein
MPDDKYHYLKNWDWSNVNEPKPMEGNETLPGKGIPSVYSAACDRVHG